MKTMSLKIKYVIIALFVCALFASAWLFVPTGKAETVIESDDDAFELIDAEYDAEQSLEFSATANFGRGNAAGLVFGAKDDIYWVFNVDRADNRVKLMYFDFSSGEKTVYVLENEYYVGSALMNEGEQNYVKSRTADIDKVYLKVIVTPAEDGTTAEFYADGIRRFAYTDGSERAKEIDLNSYTVGEDETPLTYGGGRLGYNCFNAQVDFTDEQIDVNTYYTEIYRNQYHFSQFAHWNNDPNGLVYYNGYYHLYFQHNPYGNTWDVMHWGHARSTDLVHWELLPIALVPDFDLKISETDTTPGAMWSGSARVYHKGDSDVIDSRDWFDLADKNNGDAVGLIGYYTRYDYGNRHQVLMYSTDGGLSWNKRDNIPCSTSLDLDGKPIDGGSWRDPKVFDISGLPGITDGYRWGMALTDMEDNMLFFLKSKNLVNWEHAGTYKAYRPECPDVVFLSDGERTRTVITFTSRYYTVCDLVYRDGKIVMLDGDGAEIVELMQGDAKLKKMDYGVDSYAAQTFYIDGNSDSAYAGKSVALSWFSGVPNDNEWSIESGVLQSARKVWNGGGMTIPVVYGLDGETLVTTPITKDDGNFAELKTNLVDITYAALTDGVLDGVRTRTAEIKADIYNPAHAEVSFKVNMSADGSAYTEIGWNRRDGYFVDRSYTDDADIAFPHPNYAKRYASGMGKNDVELDFYILVDRNNVEVYCADFTVPFYILTFAAPHSDRMSLTAQNAVTLNKLEVNEIAPVWRKAETELYVSESSVELSAFLTTEKEITVVGDDPAYEITSGSEVVELVSTDAGFKLKALSAGNATVTVKSGDKTRIVEVSVYSGEADSELTFNTEGVVSGEWYVDGTTVIGKQLGGDGFILAEESGANFIYSATFDLGSGAAAAIVFRAHAAGERLDSFIMANFDKNSNVVKLISQRGELRKANYTPADIHNITLCADVSGNTVRVSIDGNEVIDYVLGESEPVSGKFGLNACATRAVFKKIVTVPYEYEYGEGAAQISAGTNTRITKIVNKTLANTEIPRGFYSLEGSKIVLSEQYLSVLPDARVYSLSVTGDKMSYDVSVNVTAVPDFAPESVDISVGSDAAVFIGARDLEYVKINGKAVASSAYRVNGYTLLINGDVFEEGDNAVELSDGTQFNVWVRSTEKELISIYIPPEPLDFMPFTIGMSTTCGVILLLLIAFIVVAVLVKRGMANIKPIYRDRTEAVRRRNIGLIVAACIAGPVALIFLISAITAPLGTAGFAVGTVLAILFGYPYAAQLYWKGKLYKQTVAPIKAMGTPKEMFDLDKSIGVRALILGYIAAAFKTLWLGIRILFNGIVALIRSPFLFVGQMKAVSYGEFGHSNKAESIIEQTATEEA